MSAEVSAEAGTDVNADVSTDVTRTRVSLGPLEQVPVGEGRAFAVGGTQIAVFRPRNAAPRALPAVCPHAGGPLADGQIDDVVLVCPLHLNVWELATGCARSGQPDLPVHPLEVVDGELFVDLPEDR
jgi:nitrite reductase (NADH) small subunit